MGKGVFVYVPKVDAHQKWSIDDWFEISGEGFQSPKNEHEFLRAIHDARNGKAYTYELNGPKGLLPEGIWAKDEKEFDLHFINYGEANLPILARVNLPKGKTKATAVLINPQKKIKRNLEVAIGKTFVSFDIESPEIYSCVQVKFT